MSGDEDLSPLPPNISLFKAIEMRNWDYIVDQAKNLCQGDALMWGDVTVRTGCAPTRLLPIHYACARRAPAHVIKALLDGDPNMTKSTDSEGRLPLHWACDAGLLQGVVEILLRVFPEGARIRENKFGFLPLHIACYQQKEGFEVNPKDRMAVVEKLIKAYPEGITCRDKKGWLPLHISARTGTSAATKTLLEFFYGAAARPDKVGRLPAHLVCLNNGDEDDVGEIAEALVMSYPGSLMHREGKFGFLPLHVACSTPDSSRRLIDIFLRHHPGAAKEEDFFRSTPLHIATRANAPHDVIALLVNAFPNAARHLDKDERLPLHWACHVNADLDVIKTLIDTFWSGVLVEERKYGYTPLHIALQRSNNEDVVSYMLSCHPEAASVADKNGALPIHIACENGPDASVETLKMLLQIYPEGTEVADRFGQKPIDLASMCQDVERRSRMLKLLRQIQLIRRNGTSRTPVTSDLPIQSSGEAGSPSSQKLSDESDGSHEEISRMAQDMANRNKLSSSGLCVICLDNHASCVLYPCGHVCLCERCVETNLYSLNNVCPVGRCAFRDAVKVYGY